MENEERFIESPTGNSADTPAIKEDKMRRKAAVQGTNGDVKVCAKFTFTNKALLIVDGKVYATLKLGNPFSLKKDISVSATVNGVKYTYEYAREPHVTDNILYADGIVIGHTKNSY